MAFNSVFSLNSYGTIVATYFARVHTAVGAYVVRVFFSGLPTHSRRYERCAVYLHLHNNFLNERSRLAYVDTRYTLTGVYIRISGTCFLRFR